MIHVILMLAASCSAFVVYPEALAPTTPDGDTPRLTFVKQDARPPPRC